MLDATMTIHDVLPDEPESAAEAQPLEREPDAEPGGRADRYLAEADSGDDAPWWAQEG